MPQFFKYILHKEIKLNIKDTERNFEMELRVLEYFLAVAREQNITKAAEQLHLTQPTLSRQLIELEEEFGKKLFIRGKRKVTLTEDGLFFRKRAEEIVSLAKRTESEMKTSDSLISGDIYIGTGESIAIRNLISVAHKIQTENPGIHFHITSGDSVDLAERLEKGLFDFCVLFGDIDQSKYEYLRLPYVDRWGVLMRSDSPLASNDVVETKDLWDLPLILSRHSLQSVNFFRWLGKDAAELKIVNTYNLVYNSTFMAEEGMGYVLTLDNLVNTNGTTLSFRPIVPENTIDLYIVWKKYQSQSKAAEKFIEAMENHIENCKISK